MTSDHSLVNGAVDELPDKSIVEDHVLDKSSFEEDVALFSMPADFSGPVWGALCERMLTDIHRNHMMSPEEKEKRLKFIKLPLPGDPPTREVLVAEDPTGAYAVGATGSVLWPAAVCLIEHLDKALPTISSHTRTIELGAGLGCVGTFLCLHKGHHVVLTDVPDALPLLQRNVQENFGEDLGPEVLPLYWGDADQVRLLTSGGLYDLVVGTDITYRPDYIDDLLESAHALLAPGGRVHFALQNRPGEIDSLHSAISRSQLRTISCREAPMPKCHQEAGSALEEGAIRWHGYKAPDLVSEIFLLELEAKPAKTSTKQPVERKSFLPSALEEVEAEFFRITGVKPDPSLRPQYQSYDAQESTEEATRKVEISEQSRKNKRQELKKAIIQEYMDRGLDDLLCEADEDVAAAIGALSMKDRPRNPKEKKQFVHAFYASRAIEQEAATTLGIEEIRSDVGKQEVVEAPPKVDVEVKKCMDGIEWDVVLSEDEGKLTATIAFREELWETLQGTAFSKSSFRDAVNFELSDSDLRVTYMESPVLELHFHQTVNPSEAKAKLSSKLRQVLVHAPLC